MNKAQVRNKIEELEEERVELVEEQNELQQRVRELKSGEHTSESWEKLQATQNRLGEIDTRFSKIKHEKQKLQRRLKTAPSGEAEKLEDELDDAYEKIVELEDRLSQQLQKIKKLRAVKQDARNLFRLLNSTGLMQIASEVEDDKLVYSGKIDSVWGDGLHDIADAADKLNNSLDG